ncbi:hypothetical protein FA95DRAFT_1558085 [Auriscalpium vulgare]|uniref:Uncharacterized protein n=1 Tax=Auriscalpium vulgare TaxID=40419 RepID=A0ACB8RVZ3_9AGAM|nr:hypothetical protein FA95DRAFT_1558085 [Auriscalpium vulgare]
MLKRHRASSPPPSSPDISMLLPSDPSSSDLSHHAMKRRRIFAPSLDGPSRGWGPAPPPDDDGEDDYIEDDDAPRADQATHAMQRASEYTKVNSLLHDLHAEHQYRRVLASPVPSPPSEGARYHNPMHPPTPSAVPVGKQISISQPVPSHDFGQAAGVKSYALEGRPWPGHEGAFDETLRVQERYEDSNR